MRRSNAQGGRLYEAATIPGGAGLWTLASPLAGTEWRECDPSARISPPNALFTCDELAAALASGERTSFSSKEVSDFKIDVGGRELMYGDAIDVDPSES